MSVLSMVAVSPGRYFNWGVIQISLANLAIIVVMVVVFILALVVPFPTGHGADERGERGELGDQGDQGGLQGGRS